MKGKRPFSSEFLAPAFFTLLLLGLGALLESGLVHADVESPDADAPMAGFYEVQPENRCAPGEGAGYRPSGSIYRGERPDEAGLVFLQNLGARAIVNLEDRSLFGSDLSQEEVQMIHQNHLNLTELSHPEPDFGVNRLPNGQPDHDAMIAAVAELRKSGNFPVYVHCKHGKDRTGLIVALHRVFDECWKPADAEAEWSAIEGQWSDFWQQGKHDYFHSVMQDPILMAYYRKSLDVR